MRKHIDRLRNNEDGAAIIFGLLLSLVGFGLAYIMMLSTIQTINTANATVITNRLQNASETGINDALSLINAGYNFTENTIESPFKGKDRVVQDDNVQTDNIRWEWWVEPVDLTNRDECKRVGYSNMYNCGYYIYSRASMPVLDENAEVITRGILIPTPISLATQTETGDITYSTFGQSNFRHGIYGTNSINTASNVAFYSFFSSEESTNRKPSLSPDDNGLIRDGADNFPTSPSKSNASVSVASNQSIVLNNINNSDKQISAYNLYRSGVTEDDITPHASCMVGSETCNDLKINEQDYNYNFTDHQDWLDEICKAYLPAEAFTGETLIDLGVTCIDGDITLDKNYIAGTSQIPSILVVKGNVTIAPNANINPYTVPQAFQLYVHDGNIVNTPADGASAKFVGLMMANSIIQDKGEINLAANAQDNSLKIYGGMVAEEINLNGNITVWQDINTKYLKSNETPYYQTFSLKVVSSTRSATDLDGITGTELRPPVNLSGTPGADGTTMRITWGNPSSNKGVPLTDYTVEISNTDGEWTAVGNTPNTTYTLTGLAKYTVYNVRVKANNIYGSSAWSVIPVLTSGTKPSEPQGIQITSITNKTAILNWEPPIDDGGKDVTGYKVEYSRNANFSDKSELNVNNVTNLNLNDLIRSTTYYFRVSAINDYGISDPSVVINGTTLQTVPSSPVINSVNSTSNSITINWTAPNDNGGTPVLGYNVYRSNVQVNTQLIPISQLNYTLTGLTQSTEYDIYVTAVNALGESLKGDPATTQTIKTAPDLPVAPTVVQITEATTTSLKLSWEKPSTGGDPSQYVITKDGSIVATVNGTSQVITGLAPGTYYSFGISSKNITGVSTQQKIVNHVTTPLAPSTKPTLNKTVYLVDSEIIATASNNTCATGTTPTYKVYRNGELVQSSSTETISLSTPSTAQNISINYTLICSKNGISSLEGAASPSETVTVKTAPAAPSNVRILDIRGKNITATWDPVDEAASYEITLSTGEKVTSITNSAIIQGTIRNTAYNNDTIQPANDPYPSLNVITKDAYNFTSQPATLAEVPIARQRVFPNSDFVANIDTRYTHSDYNSLVSATGDRAFVMQGDRNLVTYNLISNKAIWAISQIPNVYPVDRWNFGTDKNFAAYRNGIDGTAFNGNDIQVLIVGGGGSGGSYVGGGGGGGGVIETTVKNVTAGSYTVTVGAGGLGAGSTTTQTSVQGNNGQNSSVFGITALGGGGGGRYAQIAGTAGGSGGGAGGFQAGTGAGGAGTAGQGNKGGDTVGPRPRGFTGGGGGGGAGAAGETSTNALNRGGNGGNGVISNILGTPYYFGGGGGGGNYADGARPGNGGLGGGGGGSSNTANVAGTGGTGGLNNGGNGSPSGDPANTGGNGGANTGGGGGGNGHYGLSGAGGSGIVVIKYAGTPKATGGAITQVGGYTIHTFTTSGTFTLTDGPTRVYCPGGCNSDVDMVSMDNGGYVTTYQWMGSYWRADTIFQ